ncbi:hypothetical protein LTR84_012766 [Exophiala bonariae]|uniref:Transcription factor domain-containing protein n=1 Tax=Exophiala bonariae TaxID=1690606 RepID=A0AAV9NG61_9EURO|nr:hypothetical protein LTR84_012766 [Exophiala bonariae]
MSQSASQSHLHFVTITGPGSMPRADSDGHQSLRSLVMQSYARHKNDPNWKFSPASISTDIKTHVTRFKTAKRSKPLKRSKRRKKADSTRNNPVRLRHIASATSALSAHDLDTVDPFQTLSIDLSESETLSLLQYYHVSFTANSYACNPEGLWFSTALMDTAILHATLALVAIHWRDTASTDTSKLYLKHRGEAMNIIVRRLSVADQAVSEATIGAVALLSSSDNHFDWSPEVQLQHSLGLARCIALRGGMKSLSTNRQILRVAGWADLLHAALHNTKPRLELPFVSAMTERSAEGTIKVTDQGAKIPFHPSDAVRVQHMPFAMAQTIQVLRELTGTKLSLLKDRNREVCQSFSNSLWRLEYSILSPQSSGVGVDSLQDADQFPGASLTDCVGTAALILSYSSLRDLVAPVLFNKLGSRLKSQLSHINSLEDFETAKSEKRSKTTRPHALGEDELSIVLWVLYLGWKSSAQNRSNREWFSSRVARLCWQNEVLSEMVLLERLRRVIPFQQYLDLKALWNGIEQSFISEISADSVYTEGEYSFEI